MSEAPQLAPFVVRFFLKPVLNENVDGIQRQFDFQLTFCVDLGTLTKRKVKKNRCPMVISEPG